MDNVLQRIEGINRHESEYLYDEIFTRRVYLRHGLYLPREAVVFDVGANIGVFSLFVTSECPTATIYAFEPVPPIFKKLESNLSDHSGRARLFHCGLSNVAAEVTFTYYPGYSTMSAASNYANTQAEKQFIKNQVLKEQAASAAEENEILESLDELLDYRFQEEHYKCQLRRLSDVIDEQNIPRIDFLKIDAQRAELDVLQGLRDEHWPLVRQIVMEVHDTAAAMTTGRVGQVVSELGERGFHCIVDQDEQLAGTDRHTVFARR